VVVVVLLLVLLLLLVARAGRTPHCSAPTAPEMVIQC
jgi:hypothetical protein